MANEFVQTMSDARVDAESLQLVVNGDEDTQVTTRLGESYPAVKKAIKLMTQAGVGFTPFETKVLMQSSALDNNAYAIVTNDTTTNNGLYLKKSNSWSKITWDIDARQKAYADAAKDAAISTASSDATAKANAAQAAAISAAATDATNKADAAKDAAINTAATDATNKADAARIAAIDASNSYTDSEILAINNTLNDNALINPSTLTTDSVINNIKDAGIYQVEQNSLAVTLGLPSGLKGQLYVSGYTNGTTGYVTQTYINTNGDSYQRVNATSTTWADWFGYAHKNIDGTVNINTLVKRGVYNAYQNGYATAVNNYPFVGAASIVIVDEQDGGGKITQQVLSAAGTAQRFATKSGGVLTWSPWAGFAYGDKGIKNAANLVSSYKSLSDLEAKANKVTGNYAEVMDDVDSNKNGKYLYTSGAWSKVITNTGLGYSKNYLKDDLAVLIKDDNDKAILTAGSDGKTSVLAHDSSLSNVVTKKDLTSFDVVIYGSGMPAITALRTAKEQGLTTCLICPDYRIGGMMTAGVVVFDGASETYAAPYGGSVSFLGGNTRKVLDEINSYYPAVSLPVPFTFEPRVAQRVFNDWLSKYADKVYLDTKIHDSFTSLSRVDNQIFGIWTRDGLMRGKQFIDASYTGDLLKAAGVSWTATTEAASEAEPDGGARVSIGFKATGVNLTTVGLTGEDAKDALRRAQFTIVSGLSDPLVVPDGAAIPNTTIGHGTRGIVTNAASRIPFTAYKTDNYDRRDHLVFLSRIIDKDWLGMSNEAIVKYVIGSQANIRTTDGSKAFNTNNAMLTQSTRLALDYPTTNWQRKLEIDAGVVNAHKDRCYFLATDSQVPQVVRDAMVEWGHSSTEWLDSPYGVGIQFKAYDRQTIRMVNNKVITAYDLRQTEDSGHITDKIGIFSYFFDGKSRLNYAWQEAPNDDTNWTIVEESRVINHTTPMYGIPMSMMLPRSGECKNLTVAWCSAMTELAFHSCRMEATGGMQGEAAAIIAKLAIDGNGSVQDVAYANVKTLLLKQNVNLGA